jgi:hypothetical protein
VALDLAPGDDNKAMAMTAAARSRSLRAVPPALALLVTGALLAAPWRAGAEPAPRPAAPGGPAVTVTGGGMGGLHRLAAVLEATLDVHRLALIEVVAAARKVLEAGRANDATPATALPPSAAEVLTRLATTVPARVPAGALPAVPRAYEAEAIDALEQLGRVGRLGLVTPLLESYGLAVSRLAGQAEEIIDLFSRKRPIETRVVDPGYMMDDLNDALDELNRAEAGISRVRERRRPLGEQLQAFMRLEVALGHALDLIAEAQEAGVHIGFEAPLSTASLSSVVKETRAHVRELESVMVEIKRPPAPLGGGLTGLVAASSDGPPYEARLTWEAPDPTAAPPALRLYRLPTRREAISHLATVLACESGDRPGAELAAQDALKDLDGQPAPLGELAPGRSSYTDALEKGRLYAPPRYRVVPVSAFGIEGKGPESTALFVPRTAEAAPLVTAALASRDATDPAFYKQGDLVEITWEPSRSELPATSAQNPEVQAWVKAGKLPVLRRYRVVRHSGDRTVTVAELEPGARAVTDRPPVADFGRGLHYSVDVVTDEGVVALERPCRQSVLRTDVAARFAAAAAGITYLSHPTAVERSALAAMKDPAELQKALAAFAARPADERNALMETWWNGLAPASRIKLFADWPQYVSRDNELAWLLEGASHISERDRPWIVTELWLLTQPPHVQREVERWWALLDTKAQSEALKSWRANLDAGHLKWVMDRVSKGDERVLRPAQVLAWWRSRDAGERERLEDWWANAAPDERRKLYREWLADQPAAVKVSVRWPDWQRHTEAERKALLSEAYRELPDGLMVHLLAWLDWHRLSGAALDQAIAGEIGWWPRVVSRARWSLRPVDLALGFHLWTVSASVAVVLPLGLVMARVRRKKKPFIR